MPSDIVDVMNALAVDFLLSLFIYYNLCGLNLQSFIATKRFLRVISTPIGGATSLGRKTFGRQTFWSTNRVYADLMVN